MPAKLMTAALCTALALNAAGRLHKAKPAEPSALDRYIAEALRGSVAGATEAAPGAIWSSAATLVDLTRELRASRVDDALTILVAESASAVAKGATKSARAASGSAAINALGGAVRPAGPWANLANLSGNTSLDGSATTSRGMTLTTTLTARVTHVLPNGYLVVEGSKDIQVNSERQAVTVRGVVRPSDLSPLNVVRSDHLAQMEIRLNGKGVVGDAIRRPILLYRLLLGLLPF